MNSFTLDHPALNQGAVQSQEPLRQPASVSIFARLWHRFRASFSFGPDLGVSILWSLLVSTSALFPLWRHGHRTSHDLLLLSAIWIVGSLLACFVARPCARFFAGNRSSESQFSAMVFFLFPLTVLVPASLFSLQYRQYFSQWHDPFLTKFWFIEFIFTGANSFYLFVATSITPLITPLGVMLAMGFCWLFKPGKRTRPSLRNMLDRI